MMASKKHILTIVTVAILIATYLIVLNMSPYIGIQLSKTKDQFFISGMDRLGWGWHSDLKTGQEILLVNDQDPSNYQTVHANSRIENADTITVLDNNEAITHNVEFSSTLSLQWLFYFLFPLLYFIFTLICIYLLLKKKSIHKSTIYLMYLMLLLSICYLSASLSTKLIEPGESFLYVTLLFAPIILLHFIYQYFYEKKIALFSKKNVYYLYLFALFVNVGIVMYRSVSNKEISPTTVLIPFLIIIGVAVYLLIQGFRLLREDRLSEVFHWLFYSFILAIAPFISLYVLPLLVFDTFIIRPELTTLFIFVVPITYLYLLVTGNLYQMKLTIQTVPYYLFISLLFSLLFDLIYYLQADNHTIVDLVKFHLLTQFSIILLLYVKNILDRHLRTSLVINQYDYQASLYRFSNLIKKETSTEIILKLASREIEEVLRLDHLKEIQLSKDTFFICTKESIDSTWIEKINRSLLKIGDIISYEQSIAIVMGENDKCYYILVEENAITNLSVDQREWLRTIAYYTSISIENARKIEQTVDELNRMRSNSRWVSKLLFSISEQERRRLASDIHDSFLQDLISLKRKTGELQNSNKSLNQEIKNIDEEILDIIEEIRETCQELYPALAEETGLKEALEELFQKFRLRTNIHLQDRISDKAFGNLSADLKIANFRIIQELLNNAIKHSNASIITLHLSINHVNRMILYYIDDGVGFDQNRLTNQMGIRGIKERVYSLSGNIDINTEVNTGVEITISFPCTKNEVKVIE